MEVGHWYETFSFKCNKKKMLCVVKITTRNSQQFTTFDDDGEEIVLISHAPRKTTPYPTFSEEWQLPK